MDFIYEQKLTASKAHFALPTMREAQAKGLSFNKYQQEMISGGWSYKRLDMLADWNRAKTVLKSKKWQGMEALDEWYSKVALPAMQSLGKTPSEFYKPKDVTIPDTITDEEEYRKWLEDMEAMKRELAERYESAY